MKRAVLILLILSLVSGLGLAGVGLALDSKRDAAYITSASEEGGGVSLEDVMLLAKAEFRGRQTAGSGTRCATTRTRTRACAPSSWASAANTPTAARATGRPS